MSENNNKSVLDNVKVDDKAFPLKGKNEEKEQPSTPLEIVNFCPRCNSPIYGQKYIRSNQKAEVKRSCDCIATANGKFDDTVRTT
jgi:hypothetical protein